MKILKIHSISDIENDLHVLDSNALVLFDIDDVLFMGKDQCLKAPYKQQLIREKIELRYSSDRAHFLKGIIWTNYAIEVVDPYIVPLIKKLRDKNIKALALTSGYAGPLGNIEKAEDLRLKRLASCEISFHWSFPHINELALSFPSIPINTPLFKKGIILCSMLAKDKVLDNFLKKIHYVPSKIVFIDDQYSHLEEVGEYCEKLNIPFVGCHYTSVATEALKIPLCKERAELQFKVLEEEHVWLSDEEADRRMKIN